MFSAESIRTFRELLRKAHRITVVSHTHPDGDALGSSTGLVTYIRGVMGKDAITVLPDTPGESIRFIVRDAVCPLLCLDAEPDKAIGRIEESDLLVLIDCNGFSRTEGLAKAMEASTAKKVLIDHHLNPQVQDFGLVFSTPDISSASELLYWILKEVEGGELPLDCCTALMAGMTTDTNNFANSVFPTTFRMASELIERGVNRDVLLDKIYREYRENRVRMMGWMQNEGLHITPDGVAWMVADEAILRRFDIREGETEGLVNVPLTIREVRMSFFLKQEDERTVRVSIRSKKGTSAQQCAVRHFHGGGHENAAGGKLIIGEDIASVAEAGAYIERTTHEFLKAGK